VREIDSQLSCLMHCDSDVTAIKFDIKDEHLWLYEKPHRGFSQSQRSTEKAAVYTLSPLQWLHRWFCVLELEVL